MRKALRAFTARGARMRQGIENARRQYQHDLQGRRTVLKELYAVEPPKKRIRGIYRTSRFNISYMHAIALWDSMEPIRGWVDHGLSEYEPGTTVKCPKIDELRRLGLV